jgi:ABC-type nitrate/sulfonate/bicarbonate transport system substrate-binding protein
MPESPIKTLAELKGKTVAINAAVMPEPFASAAEQQDGAVPLADTNQGATTSLPVEGYVVTKHWAQKYPHMLAAFYQALEQGQQIADTDRAAVENAMEAPPKPLAVSGDTAGLMSLDEYPVGTGAVGDVDQPSLQRVVDVMQQFIGFDPSFKISTMLMSGR